MLKQRHHDTSVYVLKNVYISSFFFKKLKNKIQ